AMSSLRIACSSAFPFCANEIPIPQINSRPLTAIFVAVLMRPSLPKLNSTDLDCCYTSQRSIPQIEELPHLAELLIAGCQQLPDGLIGQRHKLPVENVIQIPRCRFMVHMRATFGLRHDFVDDPLLHQVLRCDLHRVCG